jgi:endoglucanase
MMLMLGIALAGTLNGVEGAPKIAHVSLAEPSVLCVEVQVGHVSTPLARANPDFKPGYVPPSDWVWRVNGEDQGAIVGARGQFIQPVDTYSGGEWDPVQADSPSNIRLRIAGKSVTPLKVGRKSFPGNFAQIGLWRFNAEKVHRLYLTLPTAPAGKSISIQLPGLLERKLTLDSRRVRTEGLRVNQVGYRADDPEKSALFTLWMGSSGASGYTPKTFEVLDAVSLKRVLSGVPKLHNDGTKPDSVNGEYCTRAPVYLLDFSALKTPGTYRLHLPGVGCSHDFQIGPEVWRKAFLIGAKGFYYQRNGIAHGKPYTWFNAPRAFHQDDGQVVYASTCSLMDSGNGLNALGTDKDNFGNLVKGATQEVVRNTWGGYKDAGDWDSRIQHLEASRMLLELAELFPSEIAKVELNIPESKGRIPDVIAEAQWNIDHYRRLMTPEGGVRGGVEFEEHPKYGETSWTTRMKLFAYAPDPWCSWLYAASASRLASVLRPTEAKLADEYLASAEKAYGWAVKELARLNRAKLPDEVADARCLAAAELYRATRKATYEQDLQTAIMFTRDRALAGPQGEAAALIARTGLPASLAVTAREEILKAAETTLERTRETSLRQGHVNQWAYPGYGRDTSPVGGRFLLWAHQLTGESKYLAGLLQSNGFLVGINPTNTVYTSGVGSNPTRWPFMLDPRYAGGGRMPAGITVYGPLFYDKEKDGPWFTIARPFMYPEGSKWPQSETFFDSFWTIMMNEFTINQSLGPTAHVWGYLAFRK